jgi:hypothetical protein
MMVQILVRDKRRMRCLRKWSSRQPLHSGGTCKASGMISRGAVGAEGSLSGSTDHFFFNE